MPEEKETPGVEVELVGPHLRVDARPAQLVAQLRGSDGGPVLTARPIGGASRTESVPTGARQVTFRVSDELSVEATRGADFVALAGDGGRRVVVAFTGEVTVLPAGSAGDRFALAAHEAFLLADDSAEPKVVPVAALSEQEQAEVTAVMEATATAVLAPVGAGEAPAEVPTETPSDAAAEAPADVPTETPSDAATEAPADAAAAAPADGPTEAAVDVPTETPPDAATEAPADAAAAAPADGPTEAPAEVPGPVAPKAEPAQKSPPGKKAAPVPARGAKKGKKGKGRPQPAKKSAPLLVPAAGGAGKAAKTVGPVKKAAPPVKKAAGGGPGKGMPPPPRTGGGGGGAGGESYDEPGDRRVLVVTMVLGLLGALVLSVFLLTGESEERDPTAAPTTTAASEGSTTTAATATSAPAAATTTRAPTTTAPATTTSTAPAPVAKYDIEPKSCVQSGSSITYTGTITNKSTVPFDYTIAIVFKDASGATIATANATVSRLAPDKATDFTTTATGSGTPTSCDVSAVEARPSR